MTEQERIENKKALDGYVERIRQMSRDLWTSEASEDYETCAKLRDLIRQEQAEYEEFLYGLKLS